MASEPPVNGDTPETPNTPETPPTEKKSHTGLIVAIVLIVIVVLLALFFGLYFGLRNNDEPDEVNPDPDIVEPGPEDPDGGDEEPVATYINITGADSLTIHCNNSADTSTPETLDLRNTITVTVLDQYNNEYTGTYGSEYTLSTTSSEISLNTETGVVTGVSKGTAVVTVTSVANTSLTKDIEIEVIEKEYKVESITASIVDGETNSDGNILLDWGATSGELQVTFTPTYATVQTYEVTPTNDDTGLFTYDETSNTFTHTRLNTGIETFTITATDDSYSASAEITLECDPVIDEPYEVVWKNDPSLPETIAKGNSITNLDQYVEVHYHHEDQDPNEYVDDTYTLSYTGSSGVTIDGTKATFTGDGGTTQYITVTATPAHDSELSQTLYAVSSGITITQAVTELSLNYSEYVFKPLKSDTSVDLEAIFYPEDAYPLPEEQITWTVTNDSNNYIEITYDESDSSQCVVSLTDAANYIVNGQYIDGITVTASGDNVSASCNIIISTYDFATDSWDTINEVSSQGIANKVYDVGDTKENVSINSGYYTIRIIDFNHDDLTTNNSNYNKNSGKAAITVEMVDCLSGTHVINASTSTGPTNAGGWNQCGMRSWLNSTILDTLDSDLQSVIKKVNKKTNGGYQSSGMVTSSDSLFLLAYAELGGNGDSGTSDEGTIYEYWSEHNTRSENNTYPDKIKYNPSSTAIAWWTRTPYTTTQQTWHLTDTDGIIKADATSGSHGVSFAFCI